METTRHFTATVFLVNDGATALHEHDGLGIRVPPGGHVERDELPHETALREAREETGLDPTLVAEDAGIDAPGSRGLPEPRHLLLHDVNVHDDGRVGHQHVDHLYYARVDGRRIDPAPGEKPAAAWDWYGPAALRGGSFAADVVALGTEAIAVLSGE